MKTENIEIITSKEKYPAPFTHRVLILCQEKNIPYTLTTINTYEKPEWFLAIAPLAQVPVMRINQTTIFDSHAILEYLEQTFQPHLLPENPLERAQHYSWIGYANELAQEIAQLVKRGKILTADLTRLNSLLTILNIHLKGPFFFGDTFSIVDIALISHLLWLDALDQHVFLQPIITHYTKVITWLNTLKQRPSINITMGSDYAKYFIELLQKHNLI